LRSLRYRTGGYLASLLTLFLGATILMTFASLLDTSAGADPDTTTTMTIMASVVGSWGLVIVAFAVSSTLTLLVHQRHAEIALLRNVGATPAQISRMLLGEAIGLAVIAALAAITPAVFSGRLLVSLLRDSHQVPQSTQAAFGPIAISMGFGITVAAASFAALLAARRTAETSTAPGRARMIIGAVVLAGGISCGVLTATVLNRQAEALMAVAGQAAILSGIGFALLAPTIMTMVRTALAASLRRTGAGGYLTALNLRGHSRHLATALAPIILFTAIATGTLYMQSIENAAVTTMPADLATTIETLNYVVVGMIALFVAVMLTNTLVATTVRRRREFGQLRLAGTTPPQVLRMVGLEATVLATTGILFGSLAATATVIPFSLAKIGTVLPDTTIIIYLGIVLIAAVLTLAASLGTARRTIQQPAIQTIAID
jgi:putative ABC transport system permease protein